MLVSPICRGGTPCPPLRNAYQGRPQSAAPTIMKCSFDLRFTVLPVRSGYTLGAHVSTFTVLAVQPILPGFVDQTERLEYRERRNTLSHPLAASSDIAREVFDRDSVVIATAGLVGRICFISMTQRPAQVRRAVAIVDKAGNVYVQALFEWHWPSDRQMRQVTPVIDLGTAYRAFGFLEVLAQKTEPWGLDIGREPVPLILRHDGTLFRRLRPWEVD